MSTKYQGPTKVPPIRPVVKQAPHVRQPQQPPSPISAPSHGQDIPRY